MMGFVAVEFSDLSMTRDERERGVREKEVEEEGDTEGGNMGLREV